MRIAVLTFALMLAGGAALADDVGGDWCSASGAHLHIQGDTVKTPGGQMAEGVNGHHTFDVTLPEGEPDAGLSLHMQQHSETRSQVTIGDRPPEIWTRCNVTS